MSEWFRSIPHALDAVAYAAKVHANDQSNQTRLIACTAVSTGDDGIPDTIL